MTDMTRADLARFHQRYDLKQRLLFAAALSASLVLAAVLFAHNLLATEAPRASAFVRWFPILFSPLAIGAWWGAQEFIVRWRDGRPPMSADDAPNGVRIAKAGFLFSLALTAVVLGAQAVGALAAFGYTVSDWIPRATAVAFGVALVCLGNVWPRMPTPRTQARKAAAEMKINRTWGWVMVLLGLGMVLQGLLLPLLYPVLRALHAHG